jgi:hypothetical protein
LQRLNHWITAALFTLLALSGLAIFSPYLFSLTGLFGGGHAGDSSAVRRAARHQLFRTVHMVLAAEHVQS